MAVLLKYGRDVEFVKPEMETRVFESTAYGKDSPMLRGIMAALRKQRGG